MRLKRPPLTENIIVKVPPSRDPSMRATKRDQHETQERPPLSDQHERGQPRETSMRFKRDHH